MRQTGILDKAVDLLKKGGVEVFASDDVDPNPKDVDIDRQAKAFLQSKCDFTVGLGGGSSMDLAKAVAFLAAQGRCTILDYLAGGPHATLVETKPAFPIVCVTTTAGTGSETTPWWVITNTKCHEKPGTGNDSIMARCAIVDPELMVSLPREVTRNTGIDVLFHAMEAFIANMATPFTEALEAFSGVMMASRFGAGDPRSGNGFEFDVIVAGHPARRNEPQRRQGLRDRDAPRGHGGGRAWQGAGHVERPHLLAERPQGSHFRCGCDPQREDPRHGPAPLAEGVARVMPISGRGGRARAGTLAPRRSRTGAGGQR